MFDPFVSSSSPATRADRAILAVDKTDIRTNVDSNPNSQSQSQSHSQALSSDAHSSSLRSASLFGSVHIPDVCHLDGEGQYDSDNQRLIHADLSDEFTSGKSSVRSPTSGDTNAPTNGVGGSKHRAKLKKPTALGPSNRP